MLSPITFVTHVLLLGLCTAYSPELISYADAVASNTAIFPPTLLLLSHPFAEIAPPTAGDINLTFGREKTPPAASSAELARGRIYDTTAVPVIEGELVCKVGGEDITFYLWSVIKILQENGDKWCCQTRDDGKSFATYARATVGLAGMRGMCARCYDVGFAADEIMKRCGKVEGGEFEFLGNDTKVLVYHSRLRDLS